MTIADNVEQKFNYRKLLNASYDQSFKDMRLIMRRCTLKAIDRLIFDGKIFSDFC